MSSFTQISMPESPKQKRLNPEFKKEKKKQQKSISMLVNTETFHVQKPASSQ